jgi:uncharacterized protein (TIRG00374 family)
VPNTNTLSGWRFRALVYSVVLSAGGYLAFSLWGGWRDVSSAITKVGFFGVFATLLLSLANYGLRFLRWQAYLGAMGHAVPWSKSLRIYLAGFVLTTTPGKAGEMLRGLFLRRHGVPYAHSFAAFFSERLSDLLAIVILTLFGLSLYPAARPLIAAGVILVAVALMVISSKRLLTRTERLVTVALARRRAGQETQEQPGKVGVMIGHLFQMLHQARHCHSASVLAIATPLSLVGWAAEAWATYLIVVWMGVEVPLAFAVFVYATAMLAGALSFMPGGLGGTEATMVALFLWQGVGSGDAVAATVLVRLATLWFAVAIGAIAAMRLPK